MHFGSAHKIKIFCYQDVAVAILISFLFQFKHVDERMPAIKPQNAAPIPSNETPEAQTSSVIMAGSRCVSSSKAVFKLELMVLSKAKPARAITSSLGKEKKIATTVAPNAPMMSQQRPAKIVDLYRFAGLLSASLPVHIEAGIAAKPMEEQPNGASISMVKPDQLTNLEIGGV